MPDGIVSDMPMVREVTDERDAILAFLAEQRDGVANALRGLTDEQAAAKPSASKLSLGGLVKHLTACERRWVVVSVAGRADPDLWPVLDWDAEFQLTTEDTVASLLAGYAAVARETEEIVRRVDDLGAPAGTDPDFQRSIRWVLMHLIEETARHAGHADIIRESLDGADAHGVAGQAIR
ncbi:MAG TPA: DinB family protein [Pseudonocardiaceae bacterium]|nr:DinB family protein [Pseudonocardiaceae bacterium]